MDENKNVPVESQVSQDSSLATKNGAGGRRGTVVHVERPILQEAHLEEIVKRTDDEKKEVTHLRRQIIMAKLMDKDKVIKNVKSYCIGFWPVVKLIRNYPVRDYLLKDIISGISVGLIIIPQAIAYAVLASLKPENGFYSAFFGMLIYFFLGTSNHLNMSSQGVVSLMVGTVVRERASCTPSTMANSTFDPANLDCQSLIQSYTVAFTFITGLTQFILGLFRFGFFSIFLSDALVNAFTCGAAMHIVESQIPDLLGLTIANRTSGNFQFFTNLYSSFMALDTINQPAVVIAIVSGILLMLGRYLNTKIVKKFGIPIPFDIVVLLIALLASLFGEFDTRYNIRIVGDIKRGFQPFSAPQWTYMKDVIADGIVLGIVGYAMCISVAKAYSVKHGYEVDANQEFVAYGITNIILAIGNGFVSASSLACTSLHESLGGKTQIYGLVASIVTLLGIVGFGPYFKTVPQSALSAVILVNLSKMVLQVTNVITLWKINKFDWVIWLVTFVSVVCLRIEYGLAIGLVFSLVTVIYRTHSAAAYCLGRVPFTDVYRNIKRNKSAKEIPGVKIFKFEGNVYFGSAENFRTQLYAKTKLNPKKIYSRRLRENRDQCNNNNTFNSNTINGEVETDMFELPRINLTSEGDLQAEHRLSAQGRAMLVIREEDGNSDDGHRHSEEENEATDDDQITNKDTLNESEVKYVIIDMSACAFIDSVGVRVLQQIIRDYYEVDIQVYMCHVAIYVRKQLLNAGFTQDNERNHAFVTVHDAVLAATDNMRETQFLETLEAEEAFLANRAAKQDDETSNNSDEEPGLLTPTYKVGGGGSGGEGEGANRNNHHHHHHHLNHDIDHSERALLHDTIQQLMNHNKLLKQMLDKRELVANELRIEGNRDSIGETSSSNIRRVSSRTNMGGVVRRVTMKDQQRTRSSSQGNNNHAYRRSTSGDSNNASSSATTNRLAIENKADDKKCFVNETFTDSDV